MTVRDNESSGFAILQRRGGRDPIPGRAVEPDCGVVVSVPPTGFRRGWRYEIFTRALFWGAIRLPGDGLAVSLLYAGQYPPQTPTVRAIPAEAIAATAVIPNVRLVSGPRGSIIVTGDDVWVNCVDKVVAKDALLLTTGECLVAYIPITPCSYDAPFIEWDKEHGIFTV